MNNLLSEVMHPFIILSHANSSQVYNDMQRSSVTVTEQLYSSAIMANKKITSDRISCNYIKGCDKNYENRTVSNIRGPSGLIERWDSGGCCDCG
jgi:hypothetical protein